MVEYAEPDYIAQPVHEPNDPYYGDGTQWGPQKMFAPQAWDLSTGDPKVVIAVVDFGVDLQLDVDEIADTIARVLKDEDLARKLGENGRKRATKQPDRDLLKLTSRGCDGWPPGVA